MDSSVMREDKLASLLEKTKAMVNKWLELDSDEIIDIALATHIANRFNADPMWMMIIGPPSNAKTEILRAFQRLESIYFLSSVTPQTFISGQNTTVGKGKKTRKKNVSLLPELTGKTLILIDFTTILSMRHEPPDEILSQLREIYDGRIDKGFGTGATISWEGKIGVNSGMYPDLG
jgi:hypothetical protein